jgi:hypothetical protein
MGFNWYMRWRLARLVRQFQSARNHERAKAGWQDRKARAERRLHLCWKHLTCEDTWLVSMLPGIMAVEDIWLAGGLHGSLPALGPPAFDALVSLLRSPTAVVRKNVASCLREFPEAEPQLIQALADPEYGVILAAGYALREIVKRRAKESCEEPSWERTSRAEARQMALAVTLLGDQPESIVARAFLTMAESDHWHWFQMNEGVVADAPPHMREAFARILPEMKRIHQSHCAAMDSIAEAYGREQTF